MTNNDNNNERENEMTIENMNDNQEITNEDLELAAEFYDSLDFELDDEMEIEDFGTCQVAFDEMLDFENSHDELRDSDFYGYDDA